jgi:cytochrome P450
MNLGYEKIQATHNNVDTDAHDAQFIIMAYDLSTTEFLIAPAHLLAQMRAEGPLVRVKLPVIGLCWMTTTDHAARLLLKQPGVFARDPLTGTGKTLAQKYWFLPAFTSPLFENMLGREGDEHDRLRKLVERAFLKAAIDDIRRRIAAIADDLLDQIDRTQPAEIIDTYTRVLPLMVICDLLCIRQSERAKVTRWLAPLFGPTSALGMLRGLPGL